MVAIDSTYEDPLRQVPAVAPDDLTAALDLADDDLLFARLRRYNHTGRRPYDVRSMWRAVLTKYLLGIRYNVELVALLRSNAAARDACGFDDGIPNESIVCRFFKRLTRHRGLVEDAVHRLVNRVAEAINERKTPKQPPAGLMMAIDSTDIESFCDVRSKPYTDPNAAWGHRTPKHHAPNKADDQGKKDEFFFGFKMHAVCDAYWGFPVAHIILPANQSDSPTLPTLTAQALKRHPHLKPRLPDCRPGLRRHRQLQVSGQAAHPVGHPHAGYGQGRHLHDQRTPQMRGRQRDGIRRNRPEAGPSVPLSAGRMPAQEQSGVHALLQQRALRKPARQPGVAAEGRATAQGEQMVAWSIPPAHDHRAMVQQHKGIPTADAAPLPGPA